jgi:hypothetical protein
MIAEGSNAQLQELDRKIALVDAAINDARTTIKQIMRK